ncbi:unnamed protein product [[Candida] boidinii]|nr:unnamed protein product [[Candida] boidinii]
MFFTVNLDASKHPKFATEYESDPIKVETAVYEKSLEKGCLMIPGSWFRSPHFDSKGSTEIFFRGTYAAVPLDALSLGIDRFCQAVIAEYEL